MGNVRDEKMTDGLVRIVLELKESGCPSEVLNKNVRRLVPVACCEVDKVAEALKWSTETAQA